MKTHGDVKNLRSQVLKKVRRWRIFEVKNFHGEQVNYYKRVQIKGCLESKNLICKESFCEHLDLADPFKALK